MALKIDESGATIADVINERVGQRPGMRLVAFLQAWDLLRDELGRPPAVDEYAKRFGLSPPTAYRDRKLFDEAFPGQTPDEVLDLLWAWHDAHGGPLLAARVGDGEGDAVERWIDDFAAAWAGTYPPNYLEDLRNEWER
jgi:hypothetical protein